MEGYEAVSAYTGKEALQKIHDEYFDLIIMDIMLPEVDGISITETIRVSNNDVPILMLSARNSSADKVLGLKKGADDYLTKPFNLEELLLRVDKLIDKSKKMQVKESIGNTYEFGNNQIDFKAQDAITWNGQRVELSKKENHAAQTTHRKQRRSSNPRKNTANGVGLQCVSHYPHD